MTTPLPSRSTIEKEIAIRAAEYDVDCAIAIAQCNAESSFDPKAFNKSTRCIGLFQLQDTTAAWLDVDPTVWTDNIRGGMRYMQILLTRFGGDYEKALAAYNWGPGNLAKLLRRPSANPYTWKALLPDETQNYIRKILQGHAS